MFEIAKLELNHQVEALESTVQDALLQPTRNYVRPLRKIQQHYKVKNVMHGIAHITGGGLHENLGRIMPAGVHATIDKNSWSVPPVFSWLQELGEVEEAEMHRVFNMGIGLVLVVSPYFANSILTMVQESGLDCWNIGEIHEGGSGVSWS